MPFTFSHPALVIPFLHNRRRWPWLSATGLIAGSLAPDFEKFFRLQLASSYSHTVASILYFSCPVSVGLAFIFHWLVRRPLLLHLPAWLYRRVSRFDGLDWSLYFRQHYGGVLLSIIIGAAGHIFWDSFTHPNYLMMRLLPGMATLVSLGNRQVSLYEVSELVNSVLGGLITAWAIWRLPEQPVIRKPAPTALWSYWGLAALVAGGLLIQCALMGNTRWLNIGITTISASMIGVVVTSAYFQHKSPASRQLR